VATAPSSSSDRVLEPHTRSDQEVRALVAVRPEVSSWLQDDSSKLPSDVHPSHWGEGFAWRSWNGCSCPCCKAVSHLVIQCTHVFIMVSLLIVEPGVYPIMGGLESVMYLGLTLLKGSVQGIWYFDFALP